MENFRALIRDFLSPDGAEINLGFLKAKYSDSTKPSINKVLATLRGKRVLFAQMDHEIWEYVFKSLHSLRDTFIELDGSLTSKTASEIKPAVQYLTDVVTRYLADHEASYIAFMQGPSYPKLAPAHKERNWPNLGEAAEDLAVLRSMVSGAASQLDAYANGKSTKCATVPVNSQAMYWVEYAKARTFCMKCGFNMHYAYNNICPSCFPSKVPDFVAAGASRGRA